jgi:hypothetical protein
MEQKFLETQRSLSESSWTFQAIEVFLVEFFLS